ncbi:uncharacterized protein LOC127448990 [Myxocyprinus asiaticus]|uniref:uncharacterized protein LOC127448990 n=1 Tax=Myxocyprinus asiaticus TaxID=70543 RepID=UPI002223D08D|nr:uncharacterized protein LOC127448990 [Myxocyprinus asiaticus]
MHNFQKASLKGLVTNHFVIWYCLQCCTLFIFVRNTEYSQSKTAEQASVRKSAFLPLFCCICYLRCLSRLFQLLKMNIFQESCCSIFGILLFFLLQGSCVIVHKAVGSSLHLMHDIPKENLSLVQWKLNGTIFAEYDGTKLKDLKKVFAGRLRTSDISVTVEELHFQDSGSFSIVAEGPHSKQYKTKVIELHVQDLIRNVQIKSNFTWQESKNMCTFHLHCLVSGNLKPSYSWSGFEVGSEQHLHFSLHPAMSVTLNCTANNSVSIKSATLTVKCSEESISSFLQYKYLMIAVGTGIVGIVMLSGIIAVCCRWRTRKGKGDSEAEITMYEDVNSGGTAKKKKRTESVVNGISIYETVDDTRIKSNMPQTLYDKINYQRHPAVGPSTSSPYQEVL